MKSIDIKEIQALGLDTLILIDEVCKKHKLRYYLIGGTLLGAVRHSGFIPWDDDVDIAMPRTDYEKFKNIIGQYLPANNKSLQTYSLGNYPIHFLKVIDNTIVLVLMVWHRGIRTV